jgi:hypothetical protein
MGEYPVCADEIVRANAAMAAEVIACDNCSEAREIVGLDPEKLDAGFELRTRASVEVLLVLRETYAAQWGYAKARFEYLINKLKLKQATGLLTEDDLRQINLWQF